MTRRLVLPALLLLVAVGLAMLPETAAITRTVNRPPTAKLGTDPNAALSLVSFANTGFTMAGDKFSGAGSITNNFSVPMSVTITATPTVQETCQSVDGGGVCTEVAWSLALCLATDQISSGSRTCKGGQSDQLLFMGTTAGPVRPQSFKAVSVSSGQTLYMFVKGAPNKVTTTSRLCAQAAFAMTGTASEQSVQLNNGVAAPRSQIYRNGSGCP